MAPGVVGAGAAGAAVAPGVVGAGAAAAAMAPGVGAAGGTPGVVGAAPAAVGAPVAGAAEGAPVAGAAAMAPGVVGAGAAAGGAVPEVQQMDEDFHLRPIAEQRQAHEKAKEFLSDGLRGAAEVTFVQSPRVPDDLEIPAFDTVIPEGKLDASVFSWQVTDDVRDNIEKDGNRAEDTVVLYGVASQYNAGESQSRETVPPGQAVDFYEWDPTQGPAAQLAFENKQVELINAAANLGFNGLCNLLDDETKVSSDRGYFTPTKATINKVNAQLKGGTIEYPCVSSIPHGGTKPVHIMLTAAPAFGRYSIDINGADPQAEETQFLCALHAYRAQFEQSITLAQTTGKPVVFKPTACGLGVFGNQVDVVAKAFFQAAAEYQDRLRENRVTVRLQVFEGGGPAKEMADSLHLAEHV